MYFKLENDDEVNQESQPFSLVGYVSFSVIRIRVQDYFSLQPSSVAVLISPSHVLSRFITRDGARVKWLSWERCEKSMKAQFDSSPPI